MLVTKTEERIAAKIADFGLSKSRLSRSSMSECGTSAYLPPEHGKEGEVLSGSVDVFAFGGILIYVFAYAEKRCFCFIIV